MNEDLIEKYQILQFFKYEHLPTHLKDVSIPFAALAHNLAKELPHCPETSAALRKLLEAKDCAVKAKLLGTRINQG